jgi:predicted XRE-type DNA-binding protein
MVATHKDGTKTNNSLDNLRWGSYADNAEDARRHGALIMGEKQWNSKLSRVEVNEIRRLLASGVSQRKVAGLFGVSQGCVNEINTGKTWGWLADDTKTHPLNSPEIPDSSEAK